MDVFLDQALLTADASTLGEWIEAGRQAAAEKQRIIVEVRLDDRSIDDAERESLTHETPDADTIHLITASPRALALQALEDVVEALTEARTLHKRAADELTADRTKDALEIIRTILTIWQRSGLAIQQVGALLNIDLNQLDAGGRPAVDTINDLAARLAAVSERLADKDWLGLADALAFELEGAVDPWLALVAALRNKIDDPSAG